jgi:hypothetical protein
VTFAALTRGVGEKDELTFGSREEVTSDEGEDGLGFKDRHAIPNDMGEVELTFDLRLRHHLLSCAACCAASCAASCRCPSNMARLVPLSIESDDVLRQRGADVDVEQKRRSRIGMGPGRAKPERNEDTGTDKSGKTQYNWINMYWGKFTSKKCW